MSQSDALDFYSKGSTSDGKYEYTKVLLSIIDEPPYPIQLAEEHELLDILLPFPEPPVKSNHPLDALGTDEDIGLRYHTIVVLLLHRFGLRLSNHVTGSFTRVEPQDDPFVYLSLEGNIFRQPSKETAAARELLKRIIRSIGWFGLLHYMKHVSNEIIQLYFRGCVPEQKLDYRPISVWVQELARMTEAPLRSCSNGDSFAQLRPAVYLRNAPEPTIYTPLITQVTPKGRHEPVAVCQHGLMKRRRDINGVGKMTCILFGYSEDCGAMETV